jgi:hypothetical protein
VSSFGRKRASDKADPKKLRSVTIFAAVSSAKSPANPSVECAEGSNVAVVVGFTSLPNLPNQEPTPQLPLAITAAYARDQPNGPFYCSPLKGPWLSRRYRASTAILTMSHPRRIVAQNGICMICQGFHVSSF